MITTENILRMSLSLVYKHAYGWKKNFLHIAMCVKEEDGKNRFYSYLYDTYKWMYIKIRTKCYTLFIHVYEHKKKCQLIIFF